MIEAIAVCAIIGGVIFFSIRSFHRTLSGKNDSCGCGTNQCPASTCCCHRNVAGETADE